MRILFVSEHYYPQTSGVPVVVKYLAEGLVKKGHQVAVATQSCNNPLKEENCNGVKVFRFDIYVSLLKVPKGDIRDFVTFVVEYGADATILECTQCITTDVLLPYLSRIKGKRFFHIHGISGLSAGKKLFSLKSDIKHTIGNTYNYIRSLYYFGHTLKKAMPYFNATMCLSEVDDGIEYVKIYSNKNCILDNAADNMFFDKTLCSKEVLSKYTKLENDYFMMSCANYSYIKNQKGIIKQYYQSDSSKDMSLVCIGSKDNEYYNDCQSLVKDLEKKYGHRDVKLLYGVERIDIPAILNKASLYLVGSLIEQYSISIIEAMSQGVPFISTNVGNARLLPGGKTVENMEVMHNAIDEIMKNEAMFKSYSDAGRKFACENCRIDVAVEKLEKIVIED